MTTILQMRREDAQEREAARIRILDDIRAELERAYEKHGADRWGRHEWYAITLEELDEAWDEVKADADGATLAKEIIQVAAMCIRYLETGDRYRIDSPYRGDR